MLGLKLNAMTSLNQMKVWSFLHLSQFTFKLLDYLLVNKIKFVYEFFKY
jgi:hypothetical protein